MSNLIGQRLGQYEVVAFLGKGGMATVYRATQSSMGRDVAIKVIKPDLAEAPGFAERFQREARTIASLGHPHILKVFDYGQHEDTVYLVMEMLKGGSLADRINAGALPMPDIKVMLEQIGSALDYAHKRGIIHRDLKPQNVLLDESGSAYLTDFGIAKLVDANTSLTQSGTAMGTPAYMSPEQWRGEAVDSRADVYALGVMLFEMLTGVLPYRAETPYSMMHKHVSETLPSARVMRPDLPANIDAVLTKAVAKNREERYAKASEIAMAFDTALATARRAARDSDPREAPTLVERAPVLPTAPSQRTVEKKPDLAQLDQTAIIRRQRAMGFAIGGLAGAILLVAVIAFVFSRGNNSPATPTALAAVPTVITPAATQIAVLVTTQDATIAATTANIAPTLAPTIVPTIQPTVAANIAPTIAPTLPPTDVPPTLAPTTAPVVASPIPPTLAPTLDLPTIVVPTSGPTAPPNTAVASLNLTINGTLPIYNGHTGWITSVAFSQNGGALMVTGSRDYTAKLWDSTTGKSLQTFKGHNGAILGVAFSPDHSKVLTGGEDKTARLWDASTGETLQTFVNQGFVFSVAYSPDGKTVLTGSQDGVAKLWDASSGAMIRSFGPHVGWVIGVAFSPDGKTIATGSAEGKVRLWNTDSGDLIKTFTGHTGPVRSVAFSADGKYIVSSSTDKTARSWDVNAGTQVQTFGGHDDWVFSAVFSPDGKYVLTGSKDTNARLFNAATGELLHTYSGHTGWVAGVAFSPDGQYVLTGSGDMTARLWALQTTP